LAWFGLRTGQHWALWTALLSPLIAVGIALPMRYAYAFATLGHLGLVYLDALLLLAGALLEYRGLTASQPG
jgi:hypothetical protein